MIKSKINDDNTCDKVACVYVFRPKDEIYYIIGKNEQPRSLPISLLPKNGEILNTVSVDYFRLDIIYDRILNKLSHNTELTVISSHEGKFKGPLDIINTIIVQTIDIYKHQQLYGLNICKSYSNASNISASNTNVSECGASNTCAIERSDIECIEDKYKSEYTDKDNINNTTKYNLTLSSGDQENMRNKTNGLYITKPSTLLEGCNVFNTTSHFLEQINKDMNINYRIPITAVNEFIQKISLNDDLWHCGMCYIPLIHYDINSGQVQARNCIRYHVDNIDNVILHNSNSNTPTVHGLFCNVCKSNFDKICKNIKTNITYTVSDIQHICSLTNDRNMAELLCEYMSNFYHNVKCPMDCNEDIPCH